jgi:hypothetical protein
MPPYSWRQLPGWTALPPALQAESAPDPADARLQAVRDGAVDPGRGEALAMLTKDQVRAVPTNDMPAQRTFVHQVFGLAA